MQLILLVGTALADRVLWISPPDAASEAAVSRTLPGAVSQPIDTLVSGDTSGVKRDAIATLRRELDEARPLAKEFDGELQIMARLRKATEDVDLLQDPSERDLLTKALLFEGYAVHRYFQDRLGAEAAAEPYRVGTGADAQVSAWLDACALFGARPATPEDLPEEAEQLAWDEASALCKAMPTATLIVGPLAAGAELRIDGVKFEGVTGDRVRLVPGRHLFHVSIGNVLLMAEDVRIKPGTDALVTAPFGTTELAELKGRVAAGTDGWDVPTAAQVPIRGFGEPVYLAVPDGEKTRLLRVDGDKAVSVKIQRDTSAAQAGPRLAARVSLGGGWVSTGDFLLQNLDDGATETRSTVNAAAPGASVGVSLDAPLWTAGVAVDTQVALGAHHSLPSGDTDTRAFVYPHAYGGLPWVQVTVGPMFPWYLGLGGAARVPLFGPLELYATGVYGLPIEIARDDGEPAFSPEPAFSAWGGATVRLPP